MKTASLLRWGLLLLFLGLLGCSDEGSGQAESQQQPIDSLAGPRDSLHELSEKQRDSIRSSSSSIPELEEDLGDQKKLRRLILDDRVGIWEPADEATQIRFASSVATRNVRDLVDAFNDRFAEPFGLELRLRSVEGPVARLGVDDDTRLGERMGTTGSEMYLAVMTYTLTSLPAIDSVYLDIDEGSHARPGYYSRANWIDLVGEE